MVTVSRVRAQTFLDEMSNGRNRPCLFSCRDGEEYREYVVKFHRQLGVGIVCEFVAALVGQQLDLPIPPIAITEISPRLVEAIPKSEIRELLANDPGPHFGSLLQTNQYQPLPTGFPLPDEFMPQILNIFAFDILIQNPDRSFRIDHGKQNLLFNGQQLVLFDYELAFSFTRLIASAYLPWELRGQDWVKHHLFFGNIVRYAEKNKITFDEFCDQFMAIPENFYEEVFGLLPPGWHDQSFVDKIAAHFRLVRDNIGLFKRGLLEALA